jgi:hypothetical protein
MPEIKKLFKNEIKAREVLKDLKEIKSTN